MSRRTRRLLLTAALALGSLAAAAPPRRGIGEAAAARGCKANADCAADEFCARLFGRCEEKGICEARPKAEDCRERGHIHVKPVCGCDGKSYDNACLAAVEAVNVKSEGKCAA